MFKILGYSLLLALPLWVYSWPALEFPVKMEINGTPSIGKVIINTPYEFPIVLALSILSACYCFRKISNKYLIICCLAVSLLVSFFCYQNNNSSLFGDEIVQLIM
ncbi:MAG: hypothetical protein K2X27_22160 [Candidatus Obscuribacterales bacterium]|nr:hypothetical protein [Candidatus Obscuribacterales bacterium]